MNPRIRVAQVLLSRRIGGAEALADSLHKYWLCSGIECETIYLDDEGSNTRRWARLGRLRRALRAYAPDIVLAHSNIPAIYARASRAGAPVYVVLHSASDDHATWQARLIERILLRRTAGVIAVGQEQLERYTSHFPNAKTVLIPNGVGARFTNERRPSPVPRRIVTLARVAVQKRPEFWEAVSAEFETRNPDVRFEWWGPLSGSDRLDASVLRPRSRLAKYKGPTRDSAEVLRDSDILFHPSSREAHSVTLLEAAVSGVPVVYADTLDRPSSHDVWDLRYESASVADAARVLQQVVDAWPRAADRSADLASYAFAMFGIQKTANAYLALFEADSRRNSSPAAGQG